jgi:uncharacterized protein (UPF0332 family)
VNKEQRYLLRNAIQSLEAARTLAERGFGRYAASRAYYAMFYAAQAFLAGDDLAFSSHAAVIARFGRDYAKPGRVPIEMHRQLIDAERLRRRCDYELEEEIDPGAVLEQLQTADRFVQEALDILGWLTDRSPRGLGGPGVSELRRAENP